MSAALVRLPTAAPRKVRQRLKTGPVLAAIAAGQEAGTVIALPPSHYVPPWVRRSNAEAAERRALYAAGGLTRSGAFLIAVATFSALPDEQREHALNHLRAQAHANPDALPAKAALSFAEEVEDAIAPVPPVTPGT